MITRSATALIKSLSEPAKTYSLAPDAELTIGRESSCDIVLESTQAEKVSRRHCSIKAISANSFQVCDLNSSNGTFVNGQRVQGCVPLKSGDRLRLSANGPEFQFQSVVAADTVIENVPATALDLPVFHTPPTQIGGQIAPVHSAPVPPVSSSESSPVWRKFAWVAGVIAIALVLGLGKSAVRKFVSDDRPERAPVARPAEPETPQAPAPQRGTAKANITDVLVCDSADGTSCTDNQEKFKARTTDAIVLTADIGDVPDGSMINLGLLYTTDGEKVERFKLPLEHRAGGDIAKMDYKLNRPKDGWPRGRYKFVFLVDGKQDAMSEVFVMQ